MQPKARQPVYDAYWELAAERQRIFHQRAAGLAAPWTDDPILAEFKFCNAYRASDRVSQYLIRKVIYCSDCDLSADDMLLRIVFFRLFSKEETWEAVEQRIGPLTTETFDAARIDDVLERKRSDGKTIYTSAFILCANRVYGHPRKHQNHLALLEAMFSRGRLPRAVGAATSLQDLYEAFLSWPLLGPFMAYQLAIDINYSELVDFSEDEFTAPGPGAVRGLRKCFVDPGGRRPEELIQRMVDRQEMECERLGIDFHDLFGRRLHAVDCQNLFCELDKYARVKFPDLISNRVRIKARFSPTERPLSLFYPPKWQLDDRLPRPPSAATGDLPTVAPARHGRPDEQARLVA